MKIGDRVKVIHSGEQYTSYDNWKGLVGFEWDKRDSHCVKGDIGTIINIKKHDTEKHILALVNFDDHTVIIGVEGLKVIENQKDFRNTKMKIPNKEICKKVQKRLFELGIFWNSIRRDEIHNLKATSLYIDKYNKITYMSQVDNYFNRANNIEIQWEELFEENKKINGGDSLEVKKMEKPTTKLEKEACKLAKQEAIEHAVKLKKEEYARSMRTLLALKVDMINTENKLDAYMEQYKELAEKLGVTTEDEKSLF